MKLSPWHLPPLPISTIPHSDTIQAEHALQINETPVGCVFVHNGSIIGRGMNATNRTYNGTRHAEFMAISSILSEPASRSIPSPNERESGKGVGGKKYNPEILKECDLYVTVEPCIMCASLLRQIGIRKVYYGATNEKFGGTGGVLNIHRANGKKVDGGEEKGKDSGGVDDWKGEEDRDYEVSGGWMRDEAVAMLQRFYMQENERAPQPRARGKKGVVKDGGEGVVVGQRKMGDG